MLSPPPYHSGGRHFPGQWFFTKGELAFWGYLAVSGDIFVVTTCCISWVKAGDAADFSIPHRLFPTPPSTKNYCAPSVRVSCTPRYRSRAGSALLPCPICVFSSLPALWSLWIPSASQFVWNPHGTGGKRLQSHVVARTSVLEPGRSGLNPSLMPSVWVILGASYLISLSLSFLSHKISIMVI